MCAVTHVVPVVLAALVPHMVYSLIERHTRAVVDRLELDGSIRGLGYVADNMEYRQHRELVVVLARERAGVLVWRAQRRRWEGPGPLRGGAAARAEVGARVEDCGCCHKKAVRKR